MYLSTIGISLGLNYLLHIAQNSKKPILGIVFIFTSVSILAAQMTEEKWTSSAQVRYSAEGYLGMLMSLREEYKTNNDVLLYKRFLERMIDISSEVDSKVNFLMKKEGKKITKRTAENKIYISRDGHLIETYLFQLTANTPSNAQKWLKEYINEMNTLATNSLLNEKKIITTETEKSKIKLFQYNYEPTYPLRKVGPHKAMLVSVGFLSGIFFGFLFGILNDSKKDLRT